MSDLGPGCRFADPSPLNLANDIVGCPLPSDLAPVRARLQTAEELARSIESITNRGVREDVLRSLVDHLFKAETELQTLRTLLEEEFIPHPPHPEPVKEPLTPIDFDF